MSTPEPKRPPEAPEPPIKRPEKGHSSNLFWFLMIVAVVGAIIFSFSSRWQGKKLTYSEFASRLEKQTLGPQNVFELRRSPTVITFQDRPKNPSDAKAAG